MEYHWILTLATTNYGPLRMATSAGTSMGQSSRKSAYENAVVFVSEILGVSPAEANTVFWSFEPNEI